MNILYVIAFLVLPFTINAKTDISCSAFVYGANDWNIDKNTNVSECIASVRRARQYCGGKALNFVITQHWIGNKNDKYKIEGFCVYQGGVGSCLKANNTIIQNFKNGMTQCFKEAYKQNFTTISVTPHLDHDQQTVWRNSLDMRPFLKYNNMSYFQVMLQPLVEALNTLPSNTRIRFSMQGEMSWMIVRNPLAWLNAAKSIKNSLSKFKDVKVGVSFNHNNQCGPGGTCKPSSAKEKNIDTKSLKTFMDYIGFIGISSYTKTDNPDFPLDDFMGAAMNFKTEMGYLGIDIPKLVADPNKEFIFSEIGLGGGSCNYGCIAKTPKEAVANPWVGVLGVYTPAKNPWLLPNMKAYIVSWYTKWVKWAARGTGPVMKVDYVFVWNAGSFDMMGIYKSGHGLEYRNMDIVKIVKNWNNYGIVPK